VRCREAREEVEKRLAGGDPRVDLDSIKIAAQNI
jgi:hypothetical protein